MSAPKWRPILFSTPLVQAIERGEKTETRRLIPNVVIDPETGEAGQHVIRLEGPEPKPVVFRLYAPKNRDQADRGWLVLREPPPPYGGPGDFLWVRETWRTERWWDDWSPSELDEGVALQYMAGLGNHINHPGRWRPSIHMPRWASRLSLVVLSVEVERLQWITEEGAIAEGCAGVPCGCRSHVCTDCMNTGWLESPRDQFAGLWDHINPKAPWASNPWVRVVKFWRDTP